MEGTFFGPGGPACSPDDANWRGGEPRCENFSPLSRPEFGTHAGVYGFVDLHSVTK